MMAAKPMEKVSTPALAGNASWLERLVFNHRALVVIACTLVTLVLGYHAVSKLRLNASFESMLPQSHPYIKNYLAHRADLGGLGSSIRVVVENRRGSIFEPGYLEKLRKINDEIFLVPGVDRAWVKSLWMPAVRWTEVTEEGFRGGPVMPPDYNGSAAGLAALRQNLNRAGLVGELVATDYQSSMIVVPLLDKDPVTGKPLDYAVFSRQIEEIRQRYETDPALRLEIVGFAQIVGSLIEGLTQVFLYFLVATAIAAAIIYAFTRCVRSTALVLVCSMTGVIWQLGLFSALGYHLDPYSILVPFLVFAIGISHGAQKMNGITQDVARGVSNLDAARLTFRRLFLAGVTALAADVVGFAVLMLIDIPVIRDLALSASVGVGMLIFTNLILLPVLLSYTGVSASAIVRAQRAAKRAPGERARDHWLTRFTRRPWAIGAIGIALMMGTGAVLVAHHLKIGDLDPGAPELRADSRYNRDVAYIGKHYSLSSDQFAIIQKSSADGCMQFEALRAADGLAWELEQLPAVQSTQTLAGAIRQITAGSYEGNPKWLTISRNQDVINYGARSAGTNNPDLFNGDCSITPIVAYLADHKADTLDKVVALVEDYRRRFSTAEHQLLLAAGNAGIEAATNMVVRKAWLQMQLAVYAAVIALCYVTFRSWRAVVIAVLPLVLTSVLCEALMVALGIGVKVATLPVIALGVGIGVDYALYLLSIQLGAQRAGQSLSAAYNGAIAVTGKVVVLVGITLAAGVITWASSPIKFQADMGILLTFMFLWNMLGAIVLIPALSHFLLPTPKGAAT